MTFSQLIKSECKKRNIKLKTMCTDCGINYKKFSERYKHKRVKVEWIIAISHYFDLDLEMLLTMEVKEA